MLCWCQTISDSACKAGGLRRLSLERLHQSVPLVGSSCPRLGCRGRGAMLHSPGPSRELGLALGHRCALLGGAWQHHGEGEAMGGVPRLPWKPKGHLLLALRRDEGWQRHSFREREQHWAWNILKSLGKRAGKECSGQSCPVLFPFKSSMLLEALQMVKIEGTGSSWMGVGKEREAKLGAGERTRLSSRRKERTRERESQGKGELGGRK